jgi:4-amino-4-deoxy-L-arabinose transferase-like glycosyltransferase
MSQIAPAETDQNWRMLLVVSILTVFFFAVTNLPWTLDDYDQAKQAFVSFQMIGQQRWLYQTTPDEGTGARAPRHSSHHINSKPPAVAWVSTGLYQITRSWDFAWRFPSFVSAIALAVLVFRGARAFGDLPALCALAAFGLNLLSVRLATLVRTDMPLALVTFATGLLIFEKIRTRTSWTTRDRISLWALLTMAMFVKGPIVWAFVLPPLVLYQLGRKWPSLHSSLLGRGGHRPRGLGESGREAVREAPGEGSNGSSPDFPSAWGGWIPWVGSFALFCLWLILGIRFIDGFYEDVVLNEFGARFHEGIHRSQPLLFYIPHLLQKFAPWSLLIIGLLVVALRKTKAATGKWLRNLSPEMFWLITWALGGILVMSLIPSKRVDRIFPAVPPLCMLLAAQIKAIVGDNVIRVRRIAALAIIFAAIFTGAYAAMRLIDGYRNDRDALVKFGREVRRIAAAEHLRYEVLPARDESMLLYLDRPRFYMRKIETTGQLTDLDGLVVPLDQEPWRSLESRACLRVQKKGEPPSRYGFFAPLPTLLKSRND